jgi:acetyl esterase/lipase
VDPFEPLRRAATFTVEQRRAQRGPLRPSWSLEYEALARTLHYYSKISHRLPLDVQRGLMSAFLKPTAVTRRTRFEKVRARGVPAEWFRPPEVASDRVLLYLHGGGYVLGSIDTHRDAICRLCEAAGVTGLAIDYRLAPEHRFPAQLEDAVAAYRWLIDQGIAPGHIVVAGESAGGGLSLSTLCWLRDRGVPLPAGAALISPWLDLEGTGSSVQSNAIFDFIGARTLAYFRDHFVRPHQRRDPLASPLHADPSELPPLFLHAGGAEALRDDAIRMARRIDDAGGEVELHVEDDMVHAWHLFASEIAEGQAAIERVGRWVHDRLWGQASGPTMR